MMTARKMLKSTTNTFVSSGVAFVTAALLLAGNAAASDAANVSLKEENEHSASKSPGGITAWLVEEHSVPLVAMRFAFTGGSAQDPAGKEGVAHFLTAMLDEGAANLIPALIRSGWKISPCA